MNNNETKKQAESIQKRREKLLTDRRSRDTMGFLVAKGLLISNRVKPSPRVTLDIGDVIWVGENIEPRVFAVLPAAIIHFPKTFINKDKLPDELKRIVKAIRKNEILDTDFNGIQFQEMMRWANHVIQDKRVKPISEKREMKSFRLSKKAIAVIKKEAGGLGISQTEYLENLILA